MSGSRALASARRRRASADETRKPPTPLSGSSSALAPVPGSGGGSSLASVPARNMPPAPPQKINPATMLLSHNKIIENLQSVVENLNQNMETQQEESAEIQKKVDSLHMDDTNIEFFKEKVTNMDKQMNEIKRHILKVQTFAMETNLQYMELKKKLEAGRVATSDVVTSEVVTSEVADNTQIEQAEKIADILSEVVETSDEITNNDS